MFKFSKKEITQIFLLAVVFAVLFRVASIYAQQFTWSLPTMPTPEGGALPYVFNDAVIDNVITTGPVNDQKLFNSTTKKGYLELDSLEDASNSALKDGNSTLCADANGFIKCCLDDSDNNGIDDDGVCTP